MSMYTDFVANDTAAKASVYMMDRSVDSLTDIADYGIGDYSTVYSNDFGDTSSYPIPFCNPAGTLDATWGDDCTLTDATICTADFGSASDWVTPSELYQLEIDIPTSL